MTSELPRGWAKTKLENLVEILDSKRIPVNAKERAERLAAAEKTYPYYGATGQVGEIDHFIFEGDSVLLGEDGVPFFDPYKHKAYFVSGRYWVNNHAHVLRGNGAVNNRFLTYQLNVVDYRPYVSGTTRLKLTQASMRDLPIRVPPIQEQERIAEKVETLFTELDKGEESLRQVQTLLARYHQSVLKAAVTGELTADWRAERAGKFEHGRDLLDRMLQARRDQWEGRGRYREPSASDTDHLPAVPEGWVWASMEQLSSHEANSLCIGPFGSNLKVSDYRDAGVPLVFVRNIRSRVFSGDGGKFVSPEKAEELSSHRVHPGDLLITKMGDPPGDVAIYPDELAPAIITADCIRLAPARSFLDVAYLEVAIASPVVQSQIQAVTKGVAQQKITLAAFKKIAVPLPPFDEQVALSELVHAERGRANAGSAICESELRRSAALRQSILKDAFSGRLVPQDPSDEPASELLARIKVARATVPARKTIRNART